MKYMGRIYEEFSINFSNGQRIVDEFGSVGTIGTCGRRSGRSASGGGANSQR
jgi:hypothetical protein